MINYFEEEIKCTNYLIIHNETSLSFITLYVIISWTIKTTFQFLSLVDVVDLDLVACCKKLHQYFKVTHLRYQYRFPNHFWEFLLKSNSIVYYAWNFRASISIFTNFINYLDNLLYYFRFFSLSILYKIFKNKFRDSNKIIFLKFYNF